MDQAKIDYTSKLIELVKEQRLLYDTKEKAYKNIALKEAAWNKIAKELRQPDPEVVKSKWKNLRDGYTRYRKELKGVYVGQKPKYLNWVWSQNLNFLECHEVKPEKPVMKACTSSSQSSAESSSSRSSSPPPIKRTSQRKRRKRHQTLNDSENQYEKKIKNHDSSDYLFLSYCETFKKFSPRTKAHVKMEIAKIFAMAELEEYEQRTRKSENNDDPLQ